MANHLTKLIKQIKETPWQFALHQMLFLLEKASMGKAKFGCGKTINEEPAILNANCSLSSASSDCIEYKEGNQTQLTINQTNLIGINGILPQSYNEKILDRIKEKDESMLDFINIFNQRSFGILHKIAKKQNKAIDPHSQNFAFYLAGPKAKTEWEKNMQSFTMILWQQAKTPQGLLKLLTAIFNLNVKIKQFIGQWVKTDDDVQAKIGESINNKLLGAMTHLKTAIEIIIIASTLNEYESLLETTAKRREIENVCKYYITPGINFKISLALANEAEKITYLTSSRKLGENAWIC
jgi:type VI secretion system protein ImpH